MIHCLFIISVALTAEPAARYTKDMAKFAEQDRQNPPAAADAPAAHPVVFAGSSTIRIWDLGRDFPGLKALNRGFGGSQYSDLVEYAEQTILKYAPSKIVLYSGDNDLAHGKSPEQVAADVRALLTAIRQKLPETPVIIIGVKPSGARWNLREQQKRTITLIADMTQEPAFPRVTQLDVFEDFLDAKGAPDPALFNKDQLHLNEAGYAKLAARLKPLLEK